MSENQHEIEEQQPWPPTSITTTVTSVLSARLYVKYFTFIIPNLHNSSVR